jgi:hypothetical protein
MTETEVALAVRALAANSGAPTAERDEVFGADVVNVPEGWTRDEVSRTSLRRFPYIAVLGGVAGVGLLVLLVISVLIVSDDSRRLRRRHALSRSLRQARGHPRCRRRNRLNRDPARYRRRRTNRQYK